MMADEFRFRVASNEGWYEVRGEYRSRWEAVIRQAITIFGAYPFEAPRHRIEENHEIYRRFAPGVRSPNFGFTSTVVTDYPNRPDLAILTVWTPFRPEPIDELSDGAITAAMDEIRSRVSLEDKYLGSYPPKEI